MELQSGLPLQRAPTHLQPVECPTLVLQRNAPSVVSLEALESKLKKTGGGVLGLYKLTRGPAVAGTTEVTKKYEIILGG